MSVMGLNLIKEENNKRFQEKIDLEARILDLQN